MEHSTEPTGDSSKLPATSDPSGPRHVTHVDPGASSPAQAGATHGAALRDEQSGNEGLDSGIETGSSSEYDQENHGDHVIQAQEESEFSDEGYAESDATSFLSSILSEVRRGVEVAGRMYPSFGKHEYGMPIDEKELDRTDLQHHKYTLLCNGLYDAPISEEQLGQAGSRVLDLGTGTGIWAIDLAEKYPNAEIIGVDIAAIQPSFVPPNCMFEIEDVEDDWPYRPAHFDFIHGRDLMTAVRDWPRLMAQSYTHLKPGGFLELASTIPDIRSDDDTIPPNSGYLEASRLYFEMAEKMGAPLDAPRSWAEQMRAAGFVNVHDIVYKLPMGIWPRSKRLRTIGRLEQMQITDGGFEAYMLRGYTQVLGGRPEDLQVILALARNEVRDPAVHTYVHYHVTYGMKPN